MLENCKPQDVFRYFELLSSVPHGSGNTKQISDLIVDFAKEKNLEYYQDELNNVIIIKPASAGYEESEPIMIQGHMDMVCAKEDGLDMDMSVEPIKLAVDGDWLHAVGTSLGADDCIAVAIGMALLADNTIKHPRLECVFTIDEEVGMEGAEGLDVSMLKAKKLLNLDSEEEAVLTAGCAGGGRANCYVPVKRSEYEGKRYMVEIGGLMGGHSGGEIDKGRANANKLMGRFLHRAMLTCDIRVVSLFGGYFDNVITTMATSEIATSTPELFLALGDEFDKAFKNEYSTADGGVYLKITECEGRALPLDEACTKNILNALFLVPQGIREMSMDIKGLPQTSLNLGTLNLFEDSDQALLRFAVRSSIRTQKHMLCEELSAIMDLVGGYIEMKGVYPEWQYAVKSDFRDLVARITEDVLKKEVSITATHGGLECGFFCEKIPGLDVVAMGPEMYDIHSPRERVSISSVERLYSIVLRVLEESR